MFVTKMWLLYGLLAGAMLVSVRQASAKCTVTLRFTNNNSHAITVRGDDSQARVNGGAWSKMRFQDVIIQRAATVSTSWTTDMSCGGNARRDLRIKYLDAGDNIIYSERINDVNIEDGLTYGPYVLDHE
jgi:hypothetical protein